MVVTVFGLKSRAELLYAVNHGYGTPYIILGTVHAILITASLNASWGKCVLGSCFGTLADGYEDSRIEFENKITPQVQELILKESCDLLQVKLIKTSRQTNKPPRSMNGPSVWLSRDVFHTRKVLYSSGLAKLPVVLHALTTPSETERTL